MPLKYSRLKQALAARLLRRRAAESGCAAVITIADETFDAGVPTFAYQDMNFGVACRMAERLGVTMLTVQPANRDRLRQLADRQSHQYRALAGVLVMSKWFRDELVQQGIPSAAIHVVGAGLTSTAPAWRMSTDA